MRKETELQGIERTMEDIRDAAARIAGLLGIMPVMNAKKKRTTQMIATEKELEATARRMLVLADVLEQVLEMQDQDRYLQWLLTMPADSALFESRRSCFNAGNQTQGG
jgi:hypothetical protein